MVYVMLPVMMLAGYLRMSNVCRTTRNEHTPTRTRKEPSNQEISTHPALAETFRANCPQGRIVTITNQKDQPEFADVSVFGVDGPEALIETMRNG